MALRNSPQSLSKVERLRRKEDFSRVFREGKRLNLKGLTLVLASNNLSYSRLGLSVGKRVGNAVKRNRIKRLIRELFRKNKEKFPRGYDIVFIPRKGFPIQGLNDMERQVLKALKRPTGKLIRQ